MFTNYIYDREESNSSRGPLDQSQPPSAERSKSDNDRSFGIIRRYFWTFASVSRRAADSCCSWRKTSLLYLRVSSGEFLVQHLEKVEKRQVESSF